MFRSLTEILAAVAACSTIEEVATLDQNCSPNCWFEYNSEFPHTGNRNPMEVLFEATRKRND